MATPSDERIHLCKLVSASSYFFLFFKQMSNWKDVLYPYLLINAGWTRVILRVLAFNKLYLGSLYYIDINQIHTSYSEKSTKTDHDILDVCTASSPSPKHTLSVIIRSDKRMSSGGELCWTMVA